MQNPWYTLFFKAKSLEHFKAKSREHFIFTEKSFKIFTFDFFCLLDEAQFCEGQVPLTPVTWNWQLQQLPSLLHCTGQLICCIQWELHQSMRLAFGPESSALNTVDLWGCCSLLPSSLLHSALQACPCVCVWGGGGGGDRGEINKLLPLKGS